MSLQNILRPRLVEVGKLKIGGLEEKTRKAASGREWRAPIKHDYWTVTTLHRDAKGNLVPDTALMEALTARYGDPDGKLRQLPITLLSDEPDDVMQSAYCWYGSKKIAARSDGETVTWFADPQKMQLLAEPRVEPWRPELLDMKDRSGHPLFKIHTVFNCVLMSSESRWGGVYKFRTTSQITADQLFGSLLHLRQLTFGILRGLPLMLVVRPMEVAPDGKSTTVYVVHVELRGADLQAVQQIAMQQAQYQLANAKRMQTMQIEYRKLLRAPGEGETPEETSEVAEEFHPVVEAEAAPDADPLDAPMGLAPASATAATDTETPAPNDLAERVNVALKTDAGQEAFSDLFGDTVLPEELTDEERVQLLGSIAERAGTAGTDAQPSLL